MKRVHDGNLKFEWTADDITAGGGKPAKALSVKRNIAEAGAAAAVASAPAAVSAAVASAPAVASAAVASAASENDVVEENEMMDDCPDDPNEIVDDLIDDYDSDPGAMDLEEFTGPLPAEVKKGWTVVPPGPNRRGQIVPAPFKSPSTQEHTYIAAIFDSGWEIGRVVETEKGWKLQEDGVYWVKYPTEHLYYGHKLREDDYGEDKLWVIVKKDVGNSSQRAKSKSKSK